MSYKRFPLSSDIENDGISTPSNPAASKFKLYFKTDGQIYKLNSAGSEVQLATGTGDHKVIVSADDTTAGYLEEKLVAGTNVTLTVLNDAANEDLSIGLGANVVINNSVNVLTNKIYRSYFVSIDNTGSPYSALATDEIIAINATTAAVTVNLQAAATAGVGRRLTFKRLDSVIANAITIEADAAETIDGVANKLLVNQYDSYTIVCDGSNWLIV